MTGKTTQKCRVVILGSTGSIGVNTLKVIRRFPERFEVIGITALNNVDVLAAQVREFSPRHVAIAEKHYALLKKNCPGGRTKILTVETGLTQIATLPEVDTVVIGMSGRAALEPFLAAARCGKTVAPANKEALVIAGDIIMAEARRHGATVIPVDSEQSAIFQCLNGGRRQELRKVYLTASGGALRKTPQSRFKDLTVKDILNHPRWKMGQKITVDSATLMNKGFEIIEAQRLFQLETGQIEVLVHPEAIVHSMVSFQDGSILAQLGVTDMRIPIQYALTYPQRLDSGLPDVDFVALSRLTFEPPNLRKFPCLAMAQQVAQDGGTRPAVLNAADEETVAAFLKERIPFMAIHQVVAAVLARHKNRKDPGLSDVLEADAWARTEAQRYISKWTKD